MLSSLAIRPSVPTMPVYVWKKQMLPHWHWQKSCEAPATMPESLNNSVLIGINMESEAMLVQHRLLARHQRATAALWINAPSGLIFISAEEVSFGTDQTRKPIIENQERAGNQWWHSIIAVFPLSILCHRLSLSHFPALLISGLLMAIAKKQTNGWINEMAKWKGEWLSHARINLSVKQEEVGPSFALFPSQRLENR